MNEENVIIELDTVLEYRDGQVYIKKMVTSEMPVTLTFAIIEALNKTIVEYYRKRQEMKKFEDIYAELVKEHGSDSGEEFAKAMFDAGRDVSFTQNLKDLVTNEEIMVSLLTFNAIAMAERAVKVNAADLSISTEITINENKYFTRLSSITFSAEKKTLEERAVEIAKNILNSTVIYDFEAVLSKAILAGYNLRKEDFEED